MDAEALRDEKVKVLKSVRPIPRRGRRRPCLPCAVRRRPIDGEPSPATSMRTAWIPQRTETYAALKLYVDNWRWRGVPFYLRTGKRMAAAGPWSRSASSSRRSSSSAAPTSTCAAELADLSIQPQECLRLEMTVKEPGLEMRTRQTSLDASLLRRGRRHEPTPTRTC
jgi:glucose-6-phosphate 1-dehydrogenase